GRLAAPKRVIASIAREARFTPEAAPCRSQALISAPLHVRGLTKTFGDHVAIDGVSFDVKASEFLAVLGPSGAGKTPLLRCVAGLTAPDAGVVMLGDLDVTRFRGRERRGGGGGGERVHMLPSRSR